MKITARQTRVSVRQRPLHNDIFADTVKSPPSTYHALEIWKIPIALGIEIPLGRLARFDPFSLLVAHVALINKYNSETVVRAGRTSRIQAIQTADAEYRAKGWCIYVLARKE
jgi:hypothetical protein